MKTMALIYLVVLMSCINSLKADNKYIVCKGDSSILAHQSFGHATKKEAKKEDSQKVTDSSKMVKPRSKDSSTIKSYVYIFVFGPIIVACLWFLWIVVAGVLSLFGYAPKRKYDDVGNSPGDR